MELPVLDLVVRQDHLQELREDPRAILEEQIAVGRGGRHDDVPAFLGLGSKVAAQDPVHGVHRLRTAAERDDPRICLGRVVAVRQHDLVVNGDAGDLLRLFQHAGSRRHAAEHDRRDHGHPRQHPHETDRLHQGCSFRVRVRAYGRSCQRCNAAPAPKPSATWIGVRRLFSEAPCKDRFRAEQMVDGSPAPAECQSCGADQATTS